jgi:K+-sensing histidine kinase KdpD
LQRLTEDILDVTKIESQSLNLRKEKLNLNDMVAVALEDYKDTIKLLKMLVMHYSCNIKISSIENYKPFFRPQHPLVNEARQRLR